MPLTIEAALKESKAALELRLGLDSRAARIEAQMLLQQTLHVPRAHLVAHSGQCLNAAQESAHKALLQRRLAGEPMAYIFGEREFFGLTFKVTPATLIPRPETELLVELALERLPSGRTCRVLDLGTGSGAVALSIAHARPSTQVIAVDVSKAALAVARENVRRLGLENVSLLASEWFSALAGQRFDLIVSNPPYVAAGDPHLQQGDLRFEPASALASGPDGLEDIRRIIASAPAHQLPGSWLLLEHGCDQGARVRDLLQRAGFANVFSANDLAGHERVSGGQR